MLKIVSPGKNLFGYIFQKEPAASKIAITSVASSTTSSTTSGVEDYRRRLEMLKSGGNPH